MSMSVQNVKAEMQDANDKGESHWMISQASSKIAMMDIWFAESWKVMVVMRMDDLMGSTMCARAALVATRMLLQTQ